MPGFRAFIDYIPTNSHSKMSLVTLSVHYVIIFAYPAG